MRDSLKNRFPEQDELIDSIVHGIEGTRDAKIILKRTLTAGALKVGLSRTGGTAQQNSDYAAFSNVTVTFEDGSDTAEYVIPLVDDATVENEETITVRLGDPTVVDGVAQYVIDPAKREATIVLSDDDTAPQVWIESVADGAEPGSDARFVLKRSDTTRALTVSYRFDAYQSTAQYDRDFTIDGMPYEEWWGTDPYYWDYYAQPATVTFAAGSDTAEIVVRVKEDAVVEKSESALNMCLLSTE